MDQLLERAKAPILVTGVTGQVGRELMSQSDPRARPLIGLSRAKLDIEDFSQILAAIADIAPSLIINAAAYTAVDNAERNCALAFAANGDGPANLARACAAIRIPLVHISTDYVFDGLKTEPYIETDPPAPLCAYGASKLAGEEAIREHLERHVIVRTAWLFSVHRVNFVKTILRLAAEHSEIRVVDDQRGGPTAAADLAQLLLAVAEAVLHRDNELWGTYHYCGSPAVSWCAFARAIVEEAEPYLRKSVAVFPISSEDYPTAARRPANSMLNCAKTIATFDVEQSEWRSALAGVVASLVEEYRSE